MAAAGLNISHVQGQGFGVPNYPTVPQLPIENPFGSLQSAWGVPAAVGASGSAFGDYGSSPYSGYGTVGGYGYSPYSGYGVAQGRIGTAYQGAGSLYQQAQRSTSPQTTRLLQPVYDIITSAPGWNRARSAARHRPRPALPREQLLDDEGGIRWPAATPQGPLVAESRRAAEEAVRSVAAEAKKKGHASIRDVIDAKKKLISFARVALPEVKTRNAVDEASLESFIVELGKTLETFAVKY